jgi:hypothetical protein
VKKTRNAATEPLMLGATHAALRLMQLETAKIFGRSARDIADFYRTVDSS